MLNIKNLSHSFGDKPLFSLETLNLPAGEHLLILGKSGSGKTTLLNIIGGLLQPKIGQVSINGTDIYAVSEAARDKLRGNNIGFIFQKLYLIPTLTVINNLLLANYLAGKKQDRLLALRNLDTLLIKHKKDQYPENLSFGEAQRVAIARALMNSPGIILADEPTSGLDDGSCGNVIKLLMDEAGKRNSSLIVATHDGRIKNLFPNQIIL